MLLGTVHLIESYPSNCAPTEEIDYVVYMNIFLTVIYFLVFLISQFIVRYNFREEDQDWCLNFHITTVTVGFVGLTSFLFVLLVVNFFSLLDSFFGTEIVQYQIIILYIVLLVMYTLKEHEFTFPLLQHLILCKRNNAVIPFHSKLLVSLPMQQLDPANLERLEELPPGVRRVAEYVDDGGIFVG